LYPARKWVRTTTEAISMDDSMSFMFRKLFNYISGHNDQNIKIEMTVPVSVYIEPGAGPNCESKFTMAFYIPAIHQQSPPIPSDSTVSIEERPEFTALAR
jgi:SOUL heme-binding protein